MGSINRSLCPIDFSDFSKDAARVLPLHAIEDVLGEAGAQTLRTTDWR